MNFLDDKPHDYCGVFGIYSPGEDVARICFFGLYALQHRGQESAGIAVSNGREISHHKKMGLVSQVFTERNLKKLKGQIGIGHNRYSTTGSSKILNAQPLIFKSDLGDFALAHNGNLVNTVILKGRLIRDGHTFTSSSDSEIMGKMITKVENSSWEGKIKKGLAGVKGSYSLVIATQKKLFGIRDPLGVRPLVLGKFNSGWVLASESCALETIGAKTIREVLPGEGVVIDGRGLKTFLSPSGKSAFCLFEYIYFARPDSILNDRLVYFARQEMGRQLAREYPVKADFVMGVPDSGTSAAIGFAEQAKLPFYEGLIKNRYIGRTFIQPGDKLRKLGVKLKFNPLGQILKNKRVVVVDDSIVRGNTTREIVKMLKNAGAAQVHLRISSPPLRHPCYLGVDIATHQELIAHQKTIPQIKKFLGADSLGYLSLEGLKKAIGKTSCRYCEGCFSGFYPLKMVK